MIVVSVAGYLAWTLVAPVLQVPQVVSDTSEPTPTVTPWTDADGNPAPFASDDELLDYLRTARVVSETPIGVGINESKKLLLERDGVRMHAIFREVELERRHAKVGERVHHIFRDSYRFESAAYALGRLLGLDAVPPAVLRAVRGRRGSIQVWLAPTLDETNGDFRPPNAARWARQLWSMYVFDNLIFNIDRNAGNVLVDTGYKLWMIDHTRAFQIEDELLDDSIARVDRKLWGALVSLTDEEIHDTVRPHLRPREIRSLLERRAKLVRHIETLVNAHGESVILY